MSDETLDESRDGTISIFPSWIEPALDSPNRVWAYPDRADMLTRAAHLWRTLESGDRQNAPVHSLFPPTEIHPRFG